VLPHSFNIQTVSSKTPARVFICLSRKFFGDDQFVNETAAGFLLGIAENSGEFRIDLQDAVICVEQNDCFWHSRKKAAKQGLVPNRFGDCARVYPVWGELLRRTHTVNPATRPGFGECIQVEAD